MRISNQNFTINHQLRRQKAYQGFLIATGAFLSSFTIASIFSPVSPSSAQSSTDLNMSVAKESAALSLTTSGTINLTVTDPGSGEIVSGVDSLSLTSLAADGYQLYISMDNNHEHGNRLYLGGDESSGYFSPNHDSSGIDIAFGSETTLSTNSWGFTTDSTKHENKQYSAVPILGNGIMIDSQDKSGTYSKSVYYAVSANQNMSAGTYTGKVIYTIVSDEVADNYDIPSISTSSGAMDDVVTITGTLPVSVDNASDLGTVVAKIGGTNCTNQTISTSNESVSVDCTVPFLDSNGNKDVELYLQKYDKTYILENGFNYLNLNSITTMQEMTGGICKGTAAGTTKDLIDTRGRGLGGNGSAELDGTSKQTYGVIRALDGNCWMTENFDLYGVEITAEESDFESGVFTIPNTSTWSGEANTTPKVHHATKSGYTDQVYYSWTAAVALTTNGTTTEQQNQSICPKNWQLPVNGDASTDKSYTKLMDKYGVTSGSDLTNATHASYALGFTRYYGYWDWVDSEWGQGSNAYFTSSTPASSTTVYLLYYTGSAIRTQYSGRYKSEGDSIRCVSRD